MRLQYLQVKIDDRSGFYFATYVNHEGKVVYDMKLHFKRSDAVSTERHYFIEEPPPELLKPIEDYITKLINEE